MNFQFNETDEFIEINAGPVAEMARDLCKGSIHFSGYKAPFPYFVTIRATNSNAVMVRGFKFYVDAQIFTEDNAREIDFDCGFHPFCVPCLENGEQITAAIKRNDTWMCEDCANCEALK